MTTTSIHGQAQVQALFVNSSAPTSPPASSSPPWPSLNRTAYLETAQDVWYFVMLWSVIITTFLYGLVSLWSFVVLYRHRWSFLIPVVFTLMGALSGFIGGSILGGALHVLYQAGSFNMSTWIPLLWGLIHALFQLTGSYSTMTTLL